MEAMHVERIEANTGAQFTAKITCLDIDDVYTYNQPELMQLLTRKIAEFSELKIAKYV